MSKNQLFTGAVCEKKFGKQISVYRNVNLKDVMKLVGRNDVVSGTDGRLQWYRMVLNVIALMHLGIRTGCRISTHLKPFCCIASLRVSMTSQQIWLM